MLLAVSGQLVWAPIVFQLFTPELLHADAALVGEDPGVGVAGRMSWRGTTFIAPDGHTLVLVGACSSFNNVSSAVLACVAVTMLGAPRMAPPRPGDGCDCKRCHDPRQFLAGLPA